VIKVGVRLPVITDVGEYLADVTALEAAGADAIWVEDVAVEPWVLLGALAAITHRVGLGCLIASPETWPAARLGSATATLQALSRGRVMVGLPRDGARDDQLDALRAAGVRIFVTDEGLAVFDEESWATIAAPVDRDDWNATIAANESTGVTGLIVPWTDRLIDLLRNPEPDDRSDLLISTG
jgi:hypothetical protein